jgi:hypothetical protein
MKTALYIENGYTQVVLTAENEFERNALGQLKSSGTVRIEEGEFYHCQGGWARHKAVSRFAEHHDDTPPNSLMLIAVKTEEPSEGIFKNKVNCD